MPEQTPAQFNPNIPVPPGGYRIVVTMSADQIIKIEGNVSHLVVAQGMLMSALDQLRVWFSNRGAKPTESSILEASQSDLQALDRPRR